MKQLSKNTSTLLFILLTGMLVVVAFICLPGAWRATSLRESFLPDLETMAQRDRYNPELLALLGARFAEAHEYPAAASSLETAISAGKNEDVLWLAWAASLAASGNRA